MLRQAMSEVGAPPGDTMMIGDSTFDIAMARAAGVAAIGVSWGYHALAALKEAGAERVAGSYGELRKVLVRFGALPGSRTAARTPISP
jgi:phosphoglycolate phosphatase